MVTTTKSIPSKSRSCPKVYRGTALFGSKPTVASMRPKVVAMSAFTTLFPAKLESVVKAKTISAKYSAGPKRMAHRDRSGAKSMSPTTETVPPKKEATADMASAGPARPFFVMA